MASYYIRQDGGNVQGPFDRARMHELLGSGKVQPQMEFSVDGESWFPGEQIPAWFPRARGIHGVPDEVTIKATREEVAQYSSSVGPVYDVAEVYHDGIGFSAVLGFLFGVPVLAFAGLILFRLIDGLLGLGVLKPLRSGQTLLLVMIFVGALFVGLAIISVGVRAVRALRDSRLFLRAGPFGICWGLMGGPTARSLLMGYDVTADAVPWTAVTEWGVFGVLPTKKSLTRPNSLMLELRNGETRWVPLDQFGNILGAGFAGTIAKRIREGIRARPYRPT
jgi:hypothetical protein